MPIFKGAGVAIITPMDEDQNVNYDKLEEIIDEQIEGGTDAIVIVGTTGEGSTLTMEEHRCPSPDAGDGYHFYKAMKNPGFIGIDDIREIYMPMGFSNFKIEGRGLGSALVFEFIMYYMTKPEYQLFVRENIYLDNMLDLF